MSPLIDELCRVDQIHNLRVLHDSTFGGLVSQAFLSFYVIADWEEVERYETAKDSTDCTNSRCVSQPFSLCFFCVRCV